MKLLSLKLTTAIALMAVTSGYSQKATMTFNVDLNPTGLQVKDSTLNVRMKGDTEPLNWVTGIKMRDDDRDGIYSATIDFEPKEKKEVTFKYVLNDVEWEGGENLTTEIKPGAKAYNSSFRYLPRPENPFKRFIGEWTLKDDIFEQGYGQEREQVRIPEHHTLCREVNTDNSLLWVVNAPSVKGNIYWSYNHSTNEVQWLSSFYSYRSGTGKGSVDENGNASFKISFEGEPEGTYRLYTYKWISDDEYEMKSLQYNAQDDPTGSFYGGTFVKIK